MPPCLLQEATRHSLGLGRSSPTSQATGYGLGHQQPFFEDPTGAGDLLDEDEDEGWDGAYLPSAVEQTHPSRVAASTSPCSTYVSFFSNPSELVGPESLPQCTLSDSDSRVSPAGSPSTDFTVHGESLGDRHLRTLQISYEAVSEGAVRRHPGHGSCLSSILGGNLEPPVSLMAWGVGSKDKTACGLSDRRERNRQSPAEGCEGA